MRIANASDLSQMTAINLLSHGAGGEISMLRCLITQKYSASYLAPVHSTCLLFLSLPSSSVCLSLLGPSFHLYVLHFISL